MSLDRRWYDAIKDDAIASSNLIRNKIFFTVVLEKKLKHVKKFLYFKGLFLDESVSVIKHVTLGKKSYENCIRML